MYSYITAPRSWSFKAQRAPAAENPADRLKLKLARLLAQGVSDRRPFVNKWRQIDSVRGRHTAR